MEELNFLVAELAQVRGKERALLEQCKDFLSVLAAMQVRVVFCFTAQKAHLFLITCGCALLIIYFFSLFIHRLSTVV